METTFRFDPGKNIGIDKLQCVECKKPVKFISPKKLACQGKHTYQIVNNVPIMLSKDSKSLLQKSRASSSGETMKDEYNLSRKAKIKQTIKKLTAVPNISMEMFDSNKIFNTLTHNEDPNVFVVSIGGGPVRDRKTVVNLNIDTYPDVEIVGDAHNLPFKDNSLDGVVINAVLEHLEFPDIAVKEVYRVLKKGGYVLAETPFLQHYHGYPFHFQNYTVTGHNFLFRQFKILQSGAVGGPFSTVATLIMNLPEDLITNKYIRKVTLYVLGICLLPMRMMDNLVKDNPNIFKTTNGVYLFAQKE